MLCIYDLWKYMDLRAMLFWYFNIQFRPSQIEALEQYCAIKSLKLFNTRSGATFFRLFYSESDNLGVIGVTARDT